MVRGLKTGGAIFGGCWFGDVVEPMLMCLEVGRLVVKGDWKKLLFRCVEVFKNSSLHNGRYAGAKGYVCGQAVYLACSSCTLYPIASLVEISLKKQIVRYRDTHPFDSINRRQHLSRQSRGIRGLHQIGATHSNHHTWPVTPIVVFRCSIRTNDYLFQLRGPSNSNTVPPRA
jgi:hypothetical protein